MNGVATAMTGLLALVGAPWLSAMLGAPSTVPAIVGAGLIVFACLLLSQARRERVAPGVAWTIAAMDVAWVVGIIRVPRTA